MKKINVALAGLGRIGKIHLANLCQKFSNANVVGIMDVDDSSSALAEQYGIPNFVKTFDALLRLPDLDAVVICSPTDTHAQSSSWISWRTV